MIDYGVFIGNSLNESNARYRRKLLGIMLGSAAADKDFRGRIEFKSASNGLTGFFFGFVRYGAGIDYVGVGFAQLLGSFAASRF